MNKYTKTYLNELIQKTAADPYTPPNVMGVPYSNRGGLFGRGGLFNPNMVSNGVPPSRRGNYVGNSQPGILGSAANWVGNQLGSAAENIKSLANNPIANPAAGIGAAGKAIGGGLGTMLGSFGSATNNPPAPQMRTSAAPLGVRQIPNGQMIMPSQKQMISEGQMDLANYGPGSVSGPDAVTPLGNKIKQNLYQIDPNTGKALPSPPPLYPVGN